MSSHLPPGAPPFRHRGRGTTPHGFRFTCRTHLFDLDGGNMTGMCCDVDRTPLTADERVWLRAAWLKVQGGDCGVCGRRGERKRGAGLVLVNVRDHDGGTCVKGQECLSCVVGVTCWPCMTHVNRFVRWEGNVPRSAVNGLTPGEWAVRAGRFLGR